MEMLDIEMLDIEMLNIEMLKTEKKTIYFKKLNIMQY